jgi:hypothetical protein
MLHNGHYLVKHAFNRGHVGAVGGYRVGHGVSLGSTATPTIHLDIFNFSFLTRVHYNYGKLFWDNV